MLEPGGRVLHGGAASGPGEGWAGLGPGLSTWKYLGDRVTAQEHLLEGDTAHLRPLPFLLQ